MLDLDEGKVEDFAKEMGLQETVFGATCHILGARFHNPFPQLLFVFVHSKVPRVVACTQQLDCTEG